MLLWAYLIHDLWLRGLATLCQWLAQSIIRSLFKQRGRIWSKNWLIASFSEQNGPTIEFDDVRSIFDTVINQDILFVLDCSFASFAGVASRSKGPGNVKELLAAGGSEDWILAEDSFTSRFVYCFRAQLRTDPVFQVGWLFKSIVDISQKPTPLHVNLSESPTSIYLASLAPPKPVTELAPPTLHGTGQDKKHEFQH